MQLLTAMMEDEIGSIVWKIHRFSSSKVAYILFVINKDIGMYVSLVTIGRSAPEA